MYYIYNIYLAICRKGKCTFCIINGLKAKQKLVRQNYKQKRKYLLGNCSSSMILWLNFFVFCLIIVIVSWFCKYNFFPPKHFRSFFLLFRFLQWKQGQTVHRTEVIDKSDEQKNILKIWRRKKYIQKNGQ